MHTFRCESSSVKLLIQHRSNEIHDHFEDKVPPFVSSWNNLFRKWESVKKKNQTATLKNGQDILSW